MLGWKEVVHLILTCKDASTADNRLMVNGYRHHLYYSRGEWLQQWELKQRIKAAGLVSPQDHFPGVAPFAIVRHVAPDPVAVGWVLYRRLPQEVRNNIGEMLGSFGYCRWFDREFHEASQAKLCVIQVQLGVDDRLNIEP